MTGRGSRSLAHGGLAAVTCLARIDEQRTLGDVDASRRRHAEVARLGAVAAGAKRGGFDSMTEAIPKMTQPFTHTFEPNAEAAATYGELFKLYRRCHDHFGINEPDIMKDLKRIKGAAV